MKKLVVLLIISVLSALPLLALDTHEPITGKIRWVKNPPNIMYRGFNITDDITGVTTEFHWRNSTRVYVNGVYAGFKDIQQGLHASVIPEPNSTPLAAREVRITAVVIPKGVEGVQGGPSSGISEEVRPSTTPTPNKSVTSIPQTPKKETPAELVPTAELIPTAEFPRKGVIIPVEANPHYPIAVICDPNDGHRLGDIANGQVLLVGALNTNNPNKNNQYLVLTEKGIKGAVSNYRIKILDQ